jgi:hypothetical protein
MNFPIIQRKDIFEHNYSVNDLFKRFYKVSPEKLDKVKPKRPPNSFMLFRAILGIVSNDIGFKLRDGPELSKFASSFWKDANENEKRKFKELYFEFKKLHQQLFPNYKIRNKKVKRFFIVKSIKTAESYRKNEIPVSSDSCYSYQYRSMFESKYIHKPIFKGLFVNIPI